MSQKNKKLRIAMIAACPFPIPRGTPTRIKRMAEALSSLGHEIHIITYHLGERSEDLPYKIHRIPNIPFYKKMDPGPSFLKLFLIDFILSLKIYRILNEYEFDIIHAHHYEGLLTALPSRTLMSIPLLFDIHTLLETELHHYKLLINKGLIKIIGKIMDSILPRFSDSIICVSEEIRDNILKSSEVPSSKVFLVPSGVELDHFKSDPIENNSTLILGYAGNLANYQGIEEMFVAFKHVLMSYPDIKLNIYTDSNPVFFDNITGELLIDKNVHFLPTHYKTLPSQLAQTDILLNPRMEGAGYPQKLLNYMASAKPIVSYSGSSQDIIHGHSGWIIEKDEPKDFAEGIIHLIKDGGLRKRLGNNARKFVEENSNWINKAREIETIYYQLLSNSERI